jgi:hypothetical protein
MEELGQDEENNIPEAQVGHVRDGSQLIAKQWLKQRFVPGQLIGGLLNSQMEFLSGGRGRGYKSC